MIGEEEQEKEKEKKKRSGEKQRNTGANKSRKKSKRKRTKLDKGMIGKKHTDLRGRNIVGWEKEKGTNRNRKIITNSEGGQATEKKRR